MLREINRGLVSVGCYGGVPRCQAGSKDAHDCQQQEQRSASRCGWRISCLRLFCYDYVLDIFKRLW